MSFWPSKGLIPVDREPLPGRSTANRDPNLPYLKWLYNLERKKDYEALKEHRSYGIGNKRSAEEWETRARNYAYNNNKKFKSAREQKAEIDEIILNDLYMRNHDPAVLQAIHEAEYADIYTRQGFFKGLQSDLNKSKEKRANRIASKVIRENYARNGGPGKFSWDRQVAAQPLRDEVAAFIIEEKERLAAPKRIKNNLERDRLYKSINREFML